MTMLKDGSHFTFQDAYLNNLVNIVPIKDRILQVIKPQINKYFILFYFNFFLGDKSEGTTD